MFDFLPHFVALQDQAYLVLLPDGNVLPKLNTASSPAPCRATRFQLRPSKYRIYKVQRHKSFLSLVSRNRESSHRSKASSSIGIQPSSRFAIFFASKIAGVPIAARVFDTDTTLGKGADRTWEEGTFGSIIGDLGINGGADCWAGGARATKYRSFNALRCSEGQESWSKRRYTTHAAHKRKFSARLKVHPIGFFDTVPLICAARSFSSKARISCMLVVPMKPHCFRLLRTTALYPTHSS